MIYDSAKRKHPAIEELLALIRYRDLIYQLVRRDIVARYKRSVLGVAWTMLNPLGTMLIMVVVFSQVFSGTENYAAYVLTGIICWTMFSQSTSMAISNMVWGSQLFRQIYVPRTSFVVSTILANMVNFVLALVPLGIIFAITGVSLQPSALLLPVFMIFLFAFSLGVALILATLAAFFPDVADLYPILLTAWMYLTPIIMPLAFYQEILNGLLLYINPLYYIVNFFRILLLDGFIPHLQTWGATAFVSFSVLIVGWIFFCKQQTPSPTMSKTKLYKPQADTAVFLNNVSVQYRIPSEAIHTFKEYVIRMVQGKIQHQAFWALKDIKLEVKKGEIFGILGRNGAGKSTMLMVISKVLIPSEGRVWIRGEISPLLQLGAGFHPELTGRENIYLNATLLGHSRKEIDEKIDEILSFAEIGNFIEAPLRTYSSGMQSRLGFAVSTAWQPDILILDEVLSVGDMAFQEKCFDRMAKFRDGGATVLMVSHSIEQVRKHCERALWLDKGKIMVSGPVDEICDAYQSSF